MTKEGGISRRRFLAGAAGAVAGGALFPQAALARAIQAEQAAAGRNRPADLILHSGRIHIGGRASSTAESRFASAIAITNGVVTHVGPTPSVRQLNGVGTEVVDLDGRSVVPGINDSHLHLQGFGLARPPFQLDVGFPTVRSVADIQAAVQAAAEALGPGEWVRGRGWNVGDIDEWLADPSWLPSRHDLDPVSADNPVALTDFGGHALWVNSLALQLAGITRDTVPPPGGVIVKDEDGEPTGLLIEGARAPVTRIIPGFTPEQQSAAMLTAVDLLHAQGITSFTDASTGGAARARFVEHITAGRMNARVSMLVSTGSSAASVRNAVQSVNLPADLDPRWLQAQGVKIFADGVLTRGTAWMHEPYVSGGPGIEGTVGGLVVSGSTPEEQVAQLTEMIRIAHEAGFAAHVHSIGDRSNDVVVDAYINAMQLHPRPDPRHTIHHGVILTPEAIDKLAHHGLGVNMQATIMWMIADVIRSMVGPERGNRQSPFASCVERGVPVTLSSDMPVSTINWRQGIATAMLRQARQTGEVIGADERITFDQALAAYTATGAWQDFAEEWKGTLQKGMAADLAVLETDLSAVDPHELPDVEVDMTVLDGQVVYERDASPALAAAAALESTRRPMQGSCCTDDDHDRHLPEAALRARARNWRATFIEMHRAGAVRR